jgi:uncharacterized protein (UPF0332 family)
MSELLKKSKENIQSASLLIENKLYAPSIHCSYYACFQRLKTIIAEAYNCEFIELESELKTLNNVSRKKRIATHEFYINYKLNDLIRREGADHRLINKLNELKTYRNKSDYENIPIKPGISKDVFSLSQNVIQELNKLI